MERAGLAAAEWARELAGGGKRILVLAGPGNNGGDALVAARHLKSWWYQVDLVMAGDPAKLSPDAAAAWRAWNAEGYTALDTIPEDHRWCLAIDGLFGIGLARDLGGRHLNLVNQINRLALPTLALDIPSGLDADNGQIYGAAVRASHTLTFIALKPGLLTANGPDYCGEIRVADLGLEAAELSESPGRLLDHSAAAVLPPRPRNSHKGMLGSVGILGGDRSMCGAAILAGRAALKCGVGLVYVATLADAPPYDPTQPELMLCSPAQLWEKDDLRCLVAGPGLGRSAQAVEQLTMALQSPAKLVLDADALNLLGTDSELQSLLKSRKTDTLLTPHPAEAGRLLGMGSHDVQQDRVAAAAMLAERYACLVVLKGAGSIIATPDGRWFINPTGNPGMSSAGMGDALAGMLGALLAQRVPAEKALLAAVYLHGAAADELVAQGCGQIGLTASEVIEAARALLNRWNTHG
jgi:hydroxyethylthiazole kinase-like uncharacterized protein yjeF